MNLWCRRSTPAGDLRTIRDAGEARAGCASWNFL